MKRLLPILFLLVTLPSLGQEKIIYEKVFRDTSNFSLMTTFGKKIPKQLYILNATEKWNPYRFWLDELDTISQKGLKQLERDEHHPYNHSYLFTDSTLNHSLSAFERKRLRNVTANIASKKINLRGVNYRTVSSSNNIRGFYIVTTQPVFTADKNYAFIDLSIYFQDNDTQDMNDSVFGTVCVIFRREGKEWKKLKKIDYLIL